MMQIVYTGIEKESLNVIQDNLQSSEVVFVEISEDNLYEEFADKNQPKDVLIIGEKAGNPIKIAQSIHAADKHLSIMIINDPGSYHNVKQALLFTPFIGSSVQCISNARGKGLATAIEDATARTRQRRSYARLKATTDEAKFINTHIYEHVKAAYLDKFLEEAPIGAVLMNKEGHIQAINRHAAKILHKTEREVLGIPLVRLFPKDAQLSLENFIKKDFYKSSKRSFERALEDKEQCLEIRVAEISAQNQIKYKMGIIADITDKVLAQQRIKHQLEELAKINENLKRANADLDAFIYIASHDLKAPIVNIEGLIDLLKKKTKSSEPGLNRIFNMLKTSIHRFQDTIKDLTEVALIQKSNTEDEKIVDVYEVIEEVKSLMREMIESTGARVEVDCRYCKKIRFSKSSFRSIIYNLLSNAVKYSAPERKPLVEIKVEKAGKNVLLTVKDNGIGIAPDKQDKIFSMFQRLHTHVEGTGIGLHIVKRIMENTGSKIEVVSEVGRGTTFKIHLNATIAA